MDSDRAEQLREPADAPTPEIASSDGDAAGEADTEGHSMMTVDLAWTITREKVREGERRGRDAARVREAGSSREGGFLGRFRRR